MKRFYFLHRLEVPPWHLFSVSWYALFMANEGIALIHIFFRLDLDSCVVIYRCWK